MCEFLSYFLPLQSCQKFNVKLEESIKKVLNRSMNLVNKRDKPMSFYRGKEKNNLYEIMVNQKVNGDRLTKIHKKFVEKI